MFFDASERLTLTCDKDSLTSSWLMMLRLIASWRDICNQPAHCARVHGYVRASFRYLRDSSRFSVTLAGIMYGLSRGLSRGLSSSLRFHLRPPDNLGRL